MSTDKVERLFNYRLTIAVQMSMPSIGQLKWGGAFDVVSARLAQSAARAFGWTACGALLLACAERMIPVVAEKGGQLLAVELFAGLARASRRWPHAERAAARAQLSDLLRRHLVLGGYLDGATLQTALRYVVRAADPRRLAWLEAALRVEWLVDARTRPTSATRRRRVVRSSSPKCSCGRSIGAARRCARDSSTRWCAACRIRP
jgi:hypothetical protein